MFKAKKVVYVVQNKNMNHEIEIHVFETAHDAAEWIDYYSDKWLANEAEMRILVEPVMVAIKENKED